MRLRLKYVDIASDLENDIEKPLNPKLKMVQRIFMYWLITLDFTLHTIF